MDIDFEPQIQRKNINNTDEQIYLIKDNVFTTTKQIVQLERDCMRQVKNNKRIKYEKCKNPYLYNNKTTISFT